MGVGSLAVVRGCQIPEDLLYDLERQVWVRSEPDGTVVLGMTDPAQTRAGRLLRITVKPAGRRLDRGATAAVCESSKWVGPFQTPVAGTVVAANPAVLADPNLVNREPYVHWLVRLKPEAPGDLDDLLTGEEAVEAFRRYVEEHDILCLRCAE